MVSSSSLKHQRRRGSALEQGGVNTGPAKTACAVFLQHLNSPTSIGSDSNSAMPPIAERTANGTVSEAMGTLLSRSYVRRSLIGCGRSCRRYSKLNGRSVNKVACSARGRYLSTRGVRGFWRGYTAFELRDFLPSERLDGVATKEKQNGR